MEKYIAQVAENCKKRGHSFVLLNEIENSSQEYQTLLDKSDTAQVVVGESANDPLKVNRKALQYIRKWKPDVVQLQFVNSAVIPLLKVLKVPLIYQTYLSGIDHEIHIRTRLLRQIDNWFASRVIAVSDRVRSDEIRAGSHPDRIQTLYMGLPLQEYENISPFLPDRWPVGWDNSDLKKVISVGRFFPEKGMRYVVEAAVQVLQERNDVVWWLAGKNGPESEICHRMIREANLTDRIDTLGLVKDVYPLIKASYVQVVGSLSEGLPFVPLETSACGVPTIGTRIGGMDEAVINGVTGVLVERRSSKALADATRWMLDHPDQRDSMGQAARKHISDKFDSEKLIAQLLDLFESDYTKKTGVEVLHSTWNTL